LAVVAAAALLAFIFSLLSGRAQKWIAPRMWAAVAALAATFCATAARYGALSWPLAAAIAGYVLGPVVIVALTTKRGARAGLGDAAAIALLWLPLELGAGASLVPRPAQGVLHAVAYGVAVSLALVLFLAYRRLPGMKYQLPRLHPDVKNAVLGFVCAAALLIPAGLASGFLESPHVPALSLAAAIWRAALIFVGTALPEEILFRALIQNWLAQRFGDSNVAVAAAAVVFGLAHLNNAPAPNWPYVFVATLAGFIFGKVFQRSASVFAPALTHMGVNSVKHFFF
jgi:membrane protease YdiL (CAAX protease family)